MSFPFLRAPQVILSIIVNLAEPNELICLSQCSKRAYNIVKTFRKKSKNVEIYVDNLEHHLEVYLNCKLSCRLLLDSSYDREQFVRTKYPTTNLFGADFRLSFNMTGIWKLKWDDPTSDGFLTLMDWTSNLFRIDFKCVIINKDTIHRLIWVVRRQEYIDSVVSYRGHFTEDEIRFMMHLKVDKLHMDFVPLTFKYPETLPNRSRFSVTFGFWLTLNHLMTSNFEQLNFALSSLTNSDFSQFLRHWLAGGNGRMKTLVVQFNDANLNEITRGIENIIPNGDRREEVYCPLAGRELIMNDRLYLRRGDGVLATCSVIERPKRFVFAVWPDAKKRACRINNF
uniref:F-box domain-containing protein n=2 Tax=Caenorhabditis tropicalis TaxID=1561998 RepID=A0A1I7UIW9_9PELO